MTAMVAMVTLPCCDRLLALKEPQEKESAEVQLVHSLFNDLFQIHRHK